MTIDCHLNLISIVIITIIVKEFCEIEIVKAIVMTKIMAVYLLTIGTTSYVILEADFNFVAFPEQRFLELFEAAFRKNLLVITLYLEDPA